MTGWRIATIVVLVLCVCLLTGAAAFLGVPDSLSLERPHALPPDLARGCAETIGLSQDYKILHCETDGSFRDGSEFFQYHVEPNSIMSFASAVEKYGGKRGATVHRTVDQRPSMGWFPSWWDTRAIKHGYVVDLQGPREYRTSGRFCVYDLDRGFVYVCSWHT